MPLPSPATDVVGIDDELDVVTATEVGLGVGAEVEIGPDVLMYDEQYDRSEGDQSDWLKRCARQFGTVAQPQSSA
jgi:hypothetical protein